MSAGAPPWPGFGARGSLLLPLPTDAFGALAPTLDIDGLVLARKPELHLTLLRRALCVRLHAPHPGGAPAARLPALFASLDWGWRRRGERWLLAQARPEGVTHSVIELVEMPAFDAFRRAVGELLGEPIPAAPAHVTLYLAGGELGIGLPSHADFERLRLRPL